jgi:hypothetical protein
MTYSHPFANPMTFTIRPTMSERICHLLNLLTFNRLPIPSDNASEPTHLDVHRQVANKSHDRHLARLRQPGHHN